MTRLLIIVSLLWIGHADFAGAESSVSPTEPAANLNIHEFKELLEQDRILSVEKGRWSSMSGLFLNNRGDATRYRIDHIASPSPFIVEAVKAKGIEVEFAVVSGEDYSYEWTWRQPGFIVAMAIVGCVVLLHVLTFAWTIRILREVRTKG